MEKVFTFTVTVVVIAGLCLLFTYPTMWIINYLFTAQTLTALFGTSQLSFGQTFWLTWLCTALFKSTYSSK